jgi:hypothetical protein
LHFHLLVVQPDYKVTRQWSQPFHKLASLHV